MIHSCLVPFRKLWRMLDVLFDTSQTFSQTSLILVVIFYQFCFICRYFLTLLTTSNNHKEPRKHCTSQQIAITHLRQHDAQNHFPWLVGSGNSFGKFGKTQLQGFKTAVEDVKDMRPTWESQKRRKRRARRMVVVVTP